MLNTFQEVKFVNKKEFKLYCDLQIDIKILISLL